MVKHFGHVYKRNTWNLWLFGGLIGALLIFSGVWFLGEVIYNTYSPWWAILFPCFVIILTWFVVTKIGWIAEGE